ncbi:MAG: hypothetical protein H6819_12545 [Phycisphaerales bacterium]|nr:hypothetical protein [Phycisphaerales bacterium]
MESKRVALRTMSEASASDGIVQFVDGVYHWRVCSEHADFLRVHPIDWLNLAESEYATLVKRNSRRDVWRVTLDDRAYFAKVYHPNDLIGKLKVIARGSTAMREWNVGTYAAKHGIAGVVPVATAVKGFRGAGGPSLLITEAVPDVVPLNDYWEEIHSCRESAYQLADTLAQLIARAHQCGFRHGDMHPGNILVRRESNRGQTLFVDLHDVRIGKAVSMSEAVANLAQLHQWFRRHAPLTMRRRFLDRYQHHHELFANASIYSHILPINSRQLIRDLSVEADLHANALWAKRDRRSGRTGRYFTRIRPAKGWRGHALLVSKHPSPTAQAARFEYKRSQWERWLRSPLDWTTDAKSRIIKNSHTATVSEASLPVNGESPQIIVKRTLSRNALKRFLLVFRSRNAKAWRTANMLLNRDISIAQPLAIVERYKFGLFRTESLLFTDFVVGAADLERFCRATLAPMSGVMQRHLKSTLIDALVQLMRRFHNRGFAHRDFKAQNLLLQWPEPFDDRPKITMVDMDGVRYVGTAGQAIRDKALVRLAVSMLDVPGCTRTDRVRFLRRYMMRFGKSDGDWRSYWQSLDTGVREKRQRKDARRDWKMRHYGRE